MSMTPLNVMYVSTCVLVFATLLTTHPNYSLIQKCPRMTMTGQLSALSFCFAPTSGPVY